MGTLAGQLAYTQALTRQMGRSGTQCSQDASEVILVDLQGIQRCFMTPILSRSHLCSLTKSEQRRQNAPDLGRGRVLL